MRVRVAWSLEAGRAEEAEVMLEAGATVGDALRAAGLAAGTAALDLSAAGSVGIWGRAAALESVLGEGNRVELYRPLLIDPKEARRARAARAPRRR